MERKAARDRHYWKWRIVARMLVLASLAAYASRMSRNVRAMALAALRPGQAATLDFAYDGAWQANTPALAAVLETLETTYFHDGDSADDALRLALAFQALALTISALPEWFFADPPKSALAQNRTARATGAKASCSSTTIRRLEVRPGFAAGKL